MYIYRERERARARARVLPTALHAESTRRVARLPHLPGLSRLGVAAAGEGKRVEPARRNFADILADEELDEERRRLHLLVVVPQPPVLARPTRTHKHMYI